MTIRNLDASGDWTFGQGVGNYLRGEAAVELNIRTRLLCFLGDCWWSTGFGIDWWNLLVGRGPAAQTNVVVAVRAFLASSYGVTRINYVSTSLNAARKLTVKWGIDTMFSLSITGQTQP